MSAAANSLGAAQAALGMAAEHVRGWHARQTVIGGRSYVSDGHDAIARIDEAIGELYRLRGILVGEIRDDEDERAERIDRMLAESRAAREQREHGNSGPGGAL